MKPPTNLCCVIVSVLVALGGRGQVLADEPFLSSDFGKVKRGLLPDGWEAESMLVRDGNLIIFKPSEGEHSLRSSDVKDWPEDYRLTWKMRTVEVGKFSFGTARYTMQVGKVAVTLRTQADGVAGSRSTISINDTEEKIDKKTNVDSATVTMAVEKRGNVFTVFVNGAELAVARIEGERRPENFVFRVSFVGDALQQGQFKLMKIEGHKLKDD